jgi:hypothetical protein
MVQTSGQPKPITAVPADKPDQGLIYSDLTPAKKRTACVGAYQVNEGNQCTHGPDPVPAGLDVKKDVAPIAAARPEDSVPDRDPATTSSAPGPSEADVASDENGFTVGPDFAMLPDAAGSAVPEAAGSAVAVGPAGVVCDGDGTSGKRVQALYVREASTASRYARYVESFRTMAAGVDVIYNESAKASGGLRHVRYVTRADCTVDIPEVAVPAGTMKTFRSMIKALNGLGYDRTDRKYMIFADAKVYCGIGSYLVDDSPGLNNANNSGPSYGRSDSGCWSAGVAAHELTHTMGAVADSAPNSSKEGHCTDEYDLMCYEDGGLPMRMVCADKQFEERLDCNHNDYFNANPAPGSYLATHWNVASNQFLINAGTTTPPPSNPPPSDGPTVGPTPIDPTPTPSPTGPSTPTSKPPTSKPPTNPGPPPAPNPPPPDPGPRLKPLRISETSPTSIRLAWDSAGPGTQYAIIVDGQNLAKLRPTAVRIVGMKPATTYHLSVSKVVTGGTLIPYTQMVTVTTPGAPTVATGKWLTLTNAMSSRVADLGGGGGPGTPLVLDSPRRSASQQWKLEPAGDGTVTMVSKASGLCVAPKNGTDVAGTPLVQAACGGAMRWRITQTPFGTALTSASGLIVGVGGGRLCGSRMLVLQRDSGARYQSWAVRGA